MATGPGRNAPCPCGSGRKYKNCCLPADEAREREQRAALAAVPTGPAWDGFDEDERDDELDDPGPYPLLDPIRLHAAQPRLDEQDALWERFEGADYDTQVALFQEGLAEDLLDAELASEMLSELQPAGSDPEELIHFRAILDQFAHDAPALYEEDAFYYASWRIEDALAHDDPARLAAALEPFARDPAPGLDQLFQIVDQLLYYDQIALLLDAMRRGWPAMQDARGLLPALVDNYLVNLIDLVILAYLQTVPAPRADDPALIRQIGAYHGTAIVASYQQNVAALLGSLGRDWHPRDFESPPRDEPRERRLGLLGWEWLGDLWRHGVPAGRAVLAARSLVIFLVEGAGKGKSAQAMLVPTRRRLDRYLAQHFDVLGYREYAAGALVELLPQYLAFLVERELIDGGVARRALAELRPLEEEFLRTLAANLDDPAIAAAIRERWPAE